MVLFRALWVKYIRGSKLVPRSKFGMGLLAAPRSRQEDHIAKTFVSWRSMKKLFIYLLIYWFIFSKFLTWKISLWSSVGQTIDDDTCASLFGVTIWLSPAWGPSFQAEPSVWGWKRRFQVTANNVSHLFFSPSSTPCLGRRNSSWLVLCEYMTGSSLAWYQGRG